MTAGEAPVPTGGAIARLIRGRLHLAVWAAALAYFFAAPGLHYRWLASEGRSEAFNEPLPKTTTKGEIYIDEISTVTRSGEPVYRLSGWAFLTLDPALAPEGYTRTLLLKPENATGPTWKRLIGLAPPPNGYTYPTQIVRRDRLEKFFKDAPMDLTTAGFSASIATESLAPGAYRIQMLFTHPTGKTYLLRTGRTLVRTQNTVKLK